MRSQEKYLELKKIADEAGSHEVIFEEMRMFDWDANFDYDLYGKDELALCKKYSHYVGNQSQLWRDKRAIRIMLDGYRCRSCGRQDCSLSVDHCWSSYPKIPFESIWFDLTTLCWGHGSCHEAITNVEHKRVNDKKHSSLVLESHKPKVRRGSFNGRSQEVTLSPHRSFGPHYAQRPTCEPTQQMVEGNQGSLIKEDKN